MTKHAFSAVRKESLSESVYRQLSDKILRHELSPGEALPADRALSEALQVNRGPVREAIKRLHDAGLIGGRKGDDGIAPA